MLKTSDKLLMSLLTAFSMAFLFAVVEIYFYSFIPFNLLVLIELLFLSIPCFFFLLEIQDSLFAFLIGVLFSLTKNVLIDWIIVEPFPAVEPLIFGFSFFFIGLAISFHREVALTEVRIGLISTLALFFAFVFSSFILLVYFSQAPNLHIYEISIHKILRFLRIYVRI